MYALALSLRAVPAAEFHRHVVVLAIMVLFAAAAVPSVAAAHELATAAGTIVIREAPAGQRSPACGELVVEARGALDNQLIGLTHAALGDGVCRYALSVPAQSAVWLHVRPVLVAAASTAMHAAATVDTTAFVAPGATAQPRDRVSSGAVQLRFRIVSATTYFFAPGEQKDVPLTY